MPFLEDWIPALAEHLGELGAMGLLPRAALTDGAWGTVDRVVLGAMLQSVPEPWTAEEIARDRGLLPDFQVRDSFERTRAVVKYEPPQTSDERIIGRDLSRIRQAILRLRKSSTIPAPIEGTEWLLISSLPDEPVTNWPWWAWNQDLYLPPTPKSREARDASPLAYYREAIHVACGVIWKDLCQAFEGDPPLVISWINLAGDHLAVMNSNGQPREDLRLPLDLQAVGPPWPDQLK